jgi:oxygen-independent coproporphyrinogen III oxidase
MGVSDIQGLARKYSISGPRYTSYPTAPQWNEAVDAEKYRAHLGSVTQGLPLALYVHIPFCEALCYYCGCNIQITKDHGRSAAYVNSLITEISSVAKALPFRAGLSQISWGGGTPTFLTVFEMEKLYAGIRENFDIQDSAEISIEVDPRVTSEDQLRVLRRLGFNRVSLGVQDFNLEVQKAVNRVQSEAMTEAMLQSCRQLGYSGINFDLIYGLPHQTLQSFQKTVDSVLRIRPDRIALYNYAHLPSLRPHQKILDPLPKPEAEERLEIFTTAYARLISEGYRSIGMDHFALPEDELAIALRKGTLYRNFMGYTVKRGAGLVGIGASAIGEIGGAYFQNIREAKPYEEAIAKTGFGVFRGCTLSTEDHRRQWIIQNLMCRFELSFQEFQEKFGASFENTYPEELSLLKTFEPDGIVKIEERGIHVSETGRLFARNLAMAFDEYLKKPSSASYSKTV